MKQKIFFTLVLLAFLLPASATRKGVYAFFHRPNVLVEDANIQMALVIDSINNTACLMVRNKTAEVLYLDKANSFSYLNGTPKCLFSNSAQKEASTSGGGASVNLGAVAGAVGIGGALGSLLGGVNLGGGRGVENATIYYEQRILALAPQAAYIIDEWGDLREHLSKVLPKKRKEGMYWEFNETNSPLVLRGVVNYDTTEQCEHPTQLTADNYVDRIVVDKYKGIKSRNLGLTAYCQDAAEQPFFCYKIGVPKGLLIFCSCFPPTWFSLLALPAAGRSLGLVPYKADKSQILQTSGVVTGTYKNDGR